jgi:hypothetical protein
VIVYVIRKYAARYWAVINPDGSLLAVVVYKKGALAVVEALAKPQVITPPENIPAFLLKQQQEGQP